ncbi:TraR/DksA C4-type zinc finger protein [Pseudonocardia sp. KRD-291]|nr:TraR/DksA C4-type zinc finger protein [Pseudonocardia sp. KRD291]
MDIADSGSRVAESMDRDLTTGTLRRRRRQVLSALERVEDGSYGRCVVCGEPIDDERLSARPETDRCRQHPEGPDDIGEVEP